MPDSMNPKRMIIMDEWALKVVLWSENVTIY
jgi:hypothetical protein